MKSYDEPIPKKKKGENQKKKPKSDQANAYPSEDGHIYGIGRVTAQDFLFALILWYVAKTLFRL